MTVADYVLAIAGLLACLAWAAVSGLVSQIDSFMPAPDNTSARLGRGGCLSLVLALLAGGYFGGVLWNGDWGWLL